MSKRKVNTAKFLGLALLLLAGTKASYAHDIPNPANGPELAKFFDGLDASPQLPGKIDRATLESEVKEAGGNREDVDRLEKELASDVCKQEDLANFCALVGNDTIYKIRNLAFAQRDKGIAPEAVITATLPLLEYGAAQNIAKLYGEGGMSDENLAAKLKESGLRFDTERLLCAGLATAVDQKTLAATNPIYGKEYRLVTCAIGMNWYKTIKIWPFPKLSVQLGWVWTHSRFARRVLALWHLTGADSHICAYANAMNTSYATPCAPYTWGKAGWAFSPILFNQAQLPVTAGGHADRLGQSFNTQIGF